MSDRHSGSLPELLIVGERGKNQPEWPQQEHSSYDGLEDKYTDFKNNTTKRGFSRHGNRAESPGTNPTELWKKTSQPVERRSIQIHTAQRGYRKKIRKRPEDLEKGAGSYSPSLEQQQNQTGLTRPASHSEPIGGYPRLSAYFSHDEYVMKLRRFGALQAQLLNMQGELAQTEEQLRGADGEGNKIDGQPRSFRQEWDPNPAGQIFHSIERSLSRYNGVLLDWMRNEGIELRVSNGRGWENETIRGFLRNGVLLRPEQNLHPANHEANDEFWIEYGRDVNDLLLDPQRNRWLDGRICDVLGQVQSRRDHDQVLLTQWESLTNRRDQIQPDGLPEPERFDDDEEAARDRSLRRWSREWRNFLEKMQAFIFMIGTVAAWTLNIAAALALPTLTTRSANGAEIWLFVIWLISACSLVYYGCFHMKAAALDYLRRLAFLSFLTCGGIGFSLRFLGSGNAASGLPAAVTLAIIFIYIW